MKDFIWSEADEETARPLRLRLPGTVFDVHTHLFRRQDLRIPPDSQPSPLPETAGLAAWQNSVGRLIGQNRLSDGLFFPFPTAECDPVAANQFLLNELKEAPHSRGLLLISPSMTSRQIEASLAHPSIVGFKPYHLLGSARPSFQAPLSAWIPNWAWEMAEERHLILMIHLVRDKALADPVNQRELVEQLERFPNARVVLAHAGRGFHVPNTVQAVGRFREFPNVWFDASGVCESEALAAILETFGPRRLMWGSDFPINERRARCVTVGNQFAWIHPERVDDSPDSPSVYLLPTGIENLRAVWDAVDRLSLNPDDVQDLFCDNARRLLGFLPEHPPLGQTLYHHARNRIPGGVHLLSKRPEMFAPNQWPPYFREARGCECWDLDGRHYYDFSINGIGAHLLGFADPDVSRAVIRRVRFGSNCSLNPPEEVELADRLCALHPWAHRVRLARTGGEIAAVAIRIARAATDRSAVALCGYHGWHDWYLAANLGDSDALRGHLLPGLDPLGVPRELRGTAFPFPSNDRAALTQILQEQGHRLAAIIMEPCRSSDPEPGFLEFVREESRKIGALLIFDEITIGFRLCHGGAHLRFGVTPDLAIFAKALGNGHPIAAVIGTEEAMSAAENTFISSSYWTEGVGPTAACATLEKLARVNAVKVIARQGERIRTLLLEAAARHALPLRVTGYPCALSLVFEHPDPQALKTLYTQTMLEQGFLAGPLIYVSMAHTDPVLERFAVAVDRAFHELSSALKTHNLHARLRGPVAHQGFRRLI